jgi:hypothetical protein
MLTAGHGVAQTPTDPCTENIFAEEHDATQQPKTRKRYKIRTIPAFNQIEA